MQCDVEIEVPYLVSIGTIFVGSSLLLQRGKNFRCPCGLYQNFGWVSLLPMVWMSWHPAWPCLKPLSVSLQPHEGGSLVSPLSLCTGRSGVTIFSCGVCLEQNSYWLEVFWLDRLLFSCSFAYRKQASVGILFSLPSLVFPGCQLLQAHVWGMRQKENWGHSTLWHSSGSKVPSWPAFSLQLSVFLCFLKLQCL